MEEQLPVPAHKRARSLNDGDLTYLPRARDGVVNIISQKSPSYPQVPAITGRDSPWPAEIFLLGRFSIMIKGRPMEYSAEVKGMICVKRGPNNGPSPIPEEGKWVQARYPVCRGGRRGLQGQGTRHQADSAKRPTHLLR